jgi:hypothetical protein
VSNRFNGDDAAFMNQEKKEKMLLPKIMTALMDSSRHYSQGASLAWKKFFSPDNIRII